VGVERAGFEALQTLLTTAEAPLMCHQHCFSSICKGQGHVGCCEESQLHPSQITKLMANAVMTIKKATYI